MKDKITKRDKEIFARHEALRMHVCGNCVYWAFTIFERTPNHAQCSWPLVIMGEEELPPQPKFPLWLKIENRPAEPRDGGQNCPAWKIIKEGKQG